MFFLSSVIFLLFLLISTGNINSAHALTSPYRSAGWVATDGSPAFTSTTGCQVSNDGLYCSRSGASGFANLYFGSFGQLEDFGIPINSNMDKIRIRIKGKNSSSQNINITNSYNKIPFSFSCLSSFTGWAFFLGSIDKTTEIHNSISTPQLAFCINSNNINFRNLTFAISKSDFGWSADIDNFEIAFDYTPPIVTPVPIVFQEGQKGTVWEIGHDKSELKQAQALEGITSVAAWGTLKAALKSDGTVLTWTNSDNSPKQVKGENGIGFLTEVRKISAGQNSIIALKNDGTVWEWSQVGEDSQNPTSVKYAGVTITDAIDVAAGRAHKLVLRFDKKVYGWGLNTDGQIGIGCSSGNCSSVLNPQQVKNLEGVKAISGGFSHSLALKYDGTVWGWGSQSLGQLGEGVQDDSGNYNDRTLPVRLNNLGNIKSISTKNHYNLAINSDGQVVEWGESFSRKVPSGIEDLNNVSTISAGGSSAFGVLGHVIRSDGTLWQLYVNDIPPKQVPVLKNVVAVASGDSTPALAVINSPGDVLGDSTGIEPFLDLPWDYKSKNKTFEQVALNPESWFDHKYPLQNVSCCIFKVLKYTGDEQVDAYRSHSGYDYASNNGVLLNTPVLSAASGSAVLVLTKNSRGAGNVIKIDHGNGYQTWYEHLSSIGLIVGDEEQTVEVEKGQQVGKVGMTGNTNGPHIHFSVFKDENNNENFGDDYPFGLVDPLGWDGDYRDPWTEYTNKVATGSASINLFIDRALPKKELIPTSGGSLDSKDIKITVPSGASAIPFTLHLRYGPFESASATLKSAAPSFYLEAFNSVGDKIVEFLKPIVIRYNYSEADLSNFKEDTLKLHYYDILKQEWTPVSSVPSLENKIIIAELKHFTHFALMGELRDTVAPKTHINLIGDKGDGEWYRSSVAIELDGKDNEGGLGLQYVLNSFNKSEWSEYEAPIKVDKEGKHQISYQSFDKANNKEDRNKTEFNIDKTAPNTSVGIAGTKGDNGWYVTDVEVFLVSQDDGSGILRSEYVLDGGEKYQPYTGQIKISKEGETEVMYRSTDIAGNVEESKKITIQIDKTPPNSLIYISGSRGEENWYRSNVEIAIYGSDAISEYGTSFYSLDNENNYIEYFNPIIFSDEGRHRVNYYSVDKAGNMEDKKSIEIRIDKTSPIVFIDSTPKFLWPPNGRMVEVNVNGYSDDTNPKTTTFKVNDEYDLIEPLLMDFNKIINLQAKRDGSDMDGRLYTIEARSEDMAGNKESKSVSVTVPHSQ